MVGSVLLMSAGLLGSPLFIADVKARREAGHLRVEVQASGGIDPERARTRIDGGRLFLYLGGTRVRADNRAWDLDDGSGEIRAHRHKVETELVVPLARTGCAGPVELAGTAEGMTALVGCEGEAPRAPASTAKKQEMKAAAAEPTPAPAPPIATAALKLAVALPEAPAATKVPASAKPVVEDAKRAVASAPVKPVVEDEKDGDEQPAPAAKLPPAKETKATKDQKDQPKPARPEPVTKVASEVHTPPAGAPFVLPASKSEGVAAPGGLRAVAMPALLLVGLAIAAYSFARRRRTLGRRYIQILETATLGPKRSIVVARVGEETLILGASEAGITLLRTESGTAAMATTTATTTATASGAPPAGPAELEQPLMEALADIPEPGPTPGQTPAQTLPRMPAMRASAVMAAAATAPAADRDVQPATARKIAFRALEGGLAGLLGRRGADAGARPAAPAGDDAFDDLLEDSIEDQELRQKLAAGFAARVR